MRDLDALTAATPATRDRYVDFLRAVSICAVVFGHWFIGLIHREDDLVTLSSAVGVTSGLWLGTWLFQVMPIFFFVGGFSNLTAYRAVRTGRAIGSRLPRFTLARPFASGCPHRRSSLLSEAPNESPGMRPGNRP